MSSLAADLEAVAQIGRDGGGISRFAWTPELAEANRWLLGRLEEVGMRGWIDPAGNVHGLWEAGAGQAVLVGSHLDTVPQGGRYDRALGVLAALDAVRILRRRGVEPARPIRVVSWNDEEGARFRTSLLGSRAFIGDDLELEDWRARGIPEAMSEAGFDFDRLPEARGVDEVGVYLELHIEQGPVLEARRDALAGAARAVLALREEARVRTDLTANVGQITVEPGGANVVPGLAELSIDVRSATAEGFAHADCFVRETLEQIAAEEALGLGLAETHSKPPTPLDARIQELIERAADLEGATHVRLPSGAGHDAMMLARRVPAGMLFVPSRGGVSHSSDEYTTPEHCELGARVLARALELASAG